MKLQKQVLYALDAVGMITQAQARKFDTVILTTDIADTLGISKEFTRNLLSILVRNDVLVSVRGPQGGYRLSRDPQKITVADIIESLAPQEIKSLDENLMHTQTLFGQEICESLQDQTRKLFARKITDFVRPQRAGAHETRKKA